MARFLQESGPIMSLGYEVSVQTITIGNHPFVIRGLTDRQQSGEPDERCKAAGICDASWPIFGMVWPSGMILADVMDNYPFHKLRVLEVGCGLGLASMVSHRQGADITASDYHPVAETFMDENLLLNHMKPLQFALVDWKKFHTTLGKFDLIIGSDVLYEPNHPKLLAGFIDRHAADNSRVIIVDPGRRQRLDFSKRMLANGYSQVPHPLNAALADRIEFKGKVMEFTRA